MYINLKLKYPNESKHGQKLNHHYHLSTAVNKVNNALVQKDVALCYHYPYILSIHNFDKQQNPFYDVL